MVERKLYVYCDAGFANRLNALILGKIIAKRLNLKLVIYWPTNNWFGASYSDIFFSDDRSVNEAIHQINFYNMNCVGILHDNIPRAFLGNRDSELIANLETESSFFSYVSKHSDMDIFLHTVLIPAWVSEAEIGEILRGLRFTANVIESTKSFLSTMPKRGFYGLHLRRTDLVAGLNDEEVFSIISAHPYEKFFVCSDASKAEELACCQPNCVRYRKYAYVEKRLADEPWDALTKDDSGRIYSGNVNRGRRASIDSVVDFLILAHSTVLGDSGSTFHTLAKRFGSHAKVCPIESLPLINAFSFLDLKKRFSRGAIDYEQSINVLGYYCKTQEPSKAVELLFLSLHTCGEDEWINLAIVLSNLLISHKRIELAAPILAFISISSPDRARALGLELWQAVVMKQLSRGECADELVDRFISGASIAQLSKNLQVISELFPGRLATGLKVP
jgi:hypothetical protein